MLHDPEINRAYLPTNPIVFSIITAASPETAMFPVEPDGIDRSARAVAIGGGIAQLTKVFTHIRRCNITQQNMPGTGTAVLHLFPAQGEPQLIRVDIGRLG